LTIHVHEAEKLSLVQIQAFLSASETIRFEGETQAQICHWIEQVLGRQEYHQQSRQARGLLRNYVGKMTGLSRAQVTRLIARYREHQPNLLVKREGVYMSASATYYPLTALTQSFLRRANSDWEKLGISAATVCRRSKAASGQAV
jgi:hypothetical protein